MDYEYDIFISYPHKDHDEDWLTKFFLPEVKRCALEELGRELKEFVDRTGIHAGGSWPATLKRALATSRVLLPIWSVAYFKSPWCMNECSVMRHREKQLDLGTVVNVRGVIVPVRLFDGKHYPPFAKDKQWMDA
ncbi:MAG: toll/interleukin-1 receptor domain-containing protein, partial [candidate division Zixibacteria bacterium]|nr:toll/interleukin-1 receptor domain-containing protein [candidate division Zixibacteria bacterium]